MTNEGSDGPSAPIEGRWERVARPSYTVSTVHVDRPCRPFVASKGQEQRCSENRGGDFYTACNQCLTCDIPHVEAPDLMAYVRHPEDRTGVGHCIFTRQPETPAEIETAITAMCSSEVCGIRYGGQDPRILERIAARGSAALGATDSPPTRTP